VGGAAHLIGRRTQREPSFSGELVLLQGGPALVLRGELDFMTRGHVEVAFADAEAAGAPVRTVDLRELDFMDCAGLDGLVAAVRRRRADRPVVVLIGAGSGRRVLELLDVSGDLTVLDLGRDSRAARGIQPQEEAG
jgi:anti-anti-sigma factor